MLEKISIGKITCHVRAAAMLLSVALLLSCIAVFPREMLPAAAGAADSRWWALAVDSGNELRPWAEEEPSPEVIYKVKVIRDSGRVYDTGDSAAALSQELTLALRADSASLPEGAAVLEGNTVYIGGTKAAVLAVQAGNASAPEEGFPDGVGVQAGRGEDGSLLLTLTRRAEAGSGDVWNSLEPLTVTLTLQAGVLSREGSAPASVTLEAGLVSACRGTVQREEAAAQTALSPYAVNAPVAPVDSGRPPQNIFWLDNNNQERTRPTVEEYRETYAPAVYFTLGLNEAVAPEDEERQKYPHEESYLGQRIRLTAESGKLLGLTEEQVGEILRAVQDGGVNAYRFAPASLPGHAVYGGPAAAGPCTTYDVAWDFAPQEVPGYVLTQVTEEQLGTEEAHGADQAGWYYTQTLDFRFTLELRRGDMTNAETAGFTAAFSEKYKLTYEGGEINLNELGEENRLSLEWETGEDGKDTGVYTVPGLPKYTLGGVLVDYTIAPGQEDQADVSYPALEEGDFFAPTFDNSSAPGYSTETGDVIHNGGRLIFTLTGSKRYQAQKVWLDSEGDKRPEGYFELWRYPENQGVETASPVYNGNGSLVTMKLDTAKGTQQVVFSVNGEENASLPKYNAEGYEYFYVSREYLTGAGDSYEQVFGQVDADGTVHDWVEVDGELKEPGPGEERGANDIHLYNGGVLSNRRSGTVVTRAAKEWKASAFQADFTGVQVELTLQSRPAGSREEWQNARGADGRAVVRTLEGFSSESMIAELPAEAYPEFDAQGRKLEYRWVETNVLQNGSPTGLQPDGQGGGSFTLTQDLGEGTSPRRVRYVSRWERLADGSSRITNTLDNTIDYEIKKKWVNGQGEEYIPEPGTKEAVFQIYQVTSQGSLSAVPIAQYSLNGEADSQPATVREEGEWSPALEEPVTAQETEPWRALIDGLPEFDENGLKYEYVILEVDAGGNALFPTYETTLDENGNYHTVAINGYGGGNRIMVRKEWMDDGDESHRAPVTITAYTREGNRPVGSLTLEEGVWYGWLPIGQAEPADVYILETQVGNATVYGSFLPQYREGMTEEAWEAERTTQFQGDPHKYEVTYREQRVQAANVTAFLVRNRRLGNIDLTVEKTWLDGGGEGRSELQAAIAALPEGEKIYPALNLVFSELYGDEGTITYHGKPSAPGDPPVFGPDTVSLGGSQEVPIQNADGKPASSIQLLDLDPDKGTSAYYFYNLPKYNAKGQVAHYSAAEIWVDEQGREVTLSALDQKTYGSLLALAGQYSASSSSSYEATEHGKNDVQRIQMENRRSAAKIIQWHKVWRDEYASGQGNRPDIYLEIYQKGSAAGTRFYRNYQWSQNMREEGAEGENSWSATISNVPMFDGDGYEYTYYAVEKTAVDYTKFDYLEPQYAVWSADGQAEIFGSESGIADGETAKSWALKISQDGEEELYALREEGVFVNRLDAPVSVIGTKIWQDFGGVELPDTYTDFPQAVFTLTRTDGDGKEQENFASLTVEPGDWTAIRKNNNHFSILYQGENLVQVEAGGSVSIVPKDPDAPLLPKYDESGRLYHYTLGETITLPDGTEWDTVYSSPIIHQYQVKNTYHSPKATLAFEKYLYLPDGNGDGTPDAFPAVRFQVERQYETNSGGMSQWETVQTVVWTSAQVREAYRQGKSLLVSQRFLLENLPLYATNGQTYTYKVTEIKDKKGDYELGGWDTWTSADPSALEGGLTQEELAGIQKGTPQTGDASVTLPLAALQKNENAGNGRGEPKPEQEVSSLAAFVNRRSVDQPRAALTGSKVWEDYDNALGLRPEALAFTLTRFTQAQSGGSAMPEEDWAQVTVEPGEACTILLLDADGNPTADPPKGVSVACSAQNNTWTYEIQGLERYAPNGMPWQYRVTETVPDSYRAEQGTASQLAAYRAEEPYRIQMGQLKNSLTGSASFQKQWQDESGASLAADYFGEISVTFTLQVREENTADWEDAEQYFEKKLTEPVLSALFRTGGSGQPEDRSAYFQKTLTGRVNQAKGWSGSFAGLPMYRQEGTGAVKLEYRAAETKIAWGQGSGRTVLTVRPNNSDAGTSLEYESISSLFPFRLPSGAVTEKDYSQSSLLSHSQTANRLKTTQLTVEKQWENDEENAYHTRPASNAPGKDWQVDFLVQVDSGAPGEHWQSVKDYGAGGQDVVLSVAGKNSAASAEATLARLPLLSETTRYRAVELQNGWKRSQDGSIPAEYYVDTGDRCFTSYTLTQWENHSQEAGGAASFRTTAVNTMESTSAAAAKSWETYRNQNYERTPVTFTLQYYDSDAGEWCDMSQTITLDGSADQKQNGYAPNCKAYHEAMDWVAVWEFLPRYYPGSDAEQGPTQYRVKETVTGGFLSAVTEWTPGDVPGVGQPDPPYQWAYLVKNYPVASLRVAKQWRGVPEGEQKEVRVQLYRTKEAEIPQAPAEWEDATQLRKESGLKVAEEPVAPVSLNKGNQWGFTFQSLPRFAEDGTPYRYFVRELKKDNTPALEGEELDGFRVYYEDGAGSGPAFSATVRNVALTGLTVTKTWKDNGDAYGTRPAAPNFTVKLQRRTANNAWADVTGSGGQPIAPQETEQGGVWTYVFQDLPTHDGDGNAFQYRAVEVWAEQGESSRYRHEGGEAAFAGGEYTVSLTNTLQGLTSLTLTKEWLDGAGDGRPGSIQVQLYANGIPQGNPVTITSSRSPAAEFLLGKGNQWTYTFTDLPQYDNEGVRIQYTVREVAVDSGYDSQREEDGLLQPDGSFSARLVNTRLTDISVEKRWQGVASANRKPVTLALYRAAGGSAPEPVLDAQGSPLTAVLSSGTGWTHTFERLAKYSPQNLEYQYTVREYVQGGTAEEAGYTVSAGEEPGKITVTNRRLVTVQVEKAWKDNGNAYGTRPSSLALTLYRRTEASPVWEKVENAQPSWTDQEGSLWRCQFAGLPEADEKGNLYFYKAEEEPVPGYRGESSVSGPGEDGGFSVQLTNTLDGATEVPVTKEWDDENNRLGLRPERLTLKLYRNQEETPFRTAVLTAPAADPEASVWTYTFTNLPQYDETGAWYQYTVVEEGAPGRYSAHYQQTEDGGWQIRNSLRSPGGGDPGGGDPLPNPLPDPEPGSGTVDFTVTKYWHDNGNASRQRPDSLTVTLLADGQPVRTAQLNPPQGLDALAGGSVWQYTFSGLPRTDGEGKPVFYSVREEVPAGYDVRYEGGEIHNTLQGSLTISKKVEGGENREFRFAVTLEGSSLTGQYGGLAFSGGTAQFTLRGGESVTASGLPAGTAYTVTELDANQYGFRTQSVHADGVIPQGGTASAQFVNRWASPAVPQTGGPDEALPWAALCLLSAAGLAAALRWRAGWKRAGRHFRQKQPRP